MNAIESPSCSLGKNSPLAGAPACHAFDHRGPRAVSGFIPVQTRGRRRSERGQRETHRQVQSVMRRRGVEQSGLSLPANSIRRIGSSSKSEHDCRMMASLFGRLAIDPRRSITRERELAVEVPPSRWPTEARPSRHRRSRHRPLQAVARLAVALRDQHEAAGAAGRTSKVKRTHRKPPRNIVLYTNRHNGHCAVGTNSLCPFDCPNSWQKGRQGD